MKIVETGPVRKLLKRENQETLQKEGATELKETEGLEKGEGNVRGGRKGSRKIEGKPESDEGKGNKGIRRR